jgi:hypothetical protein
MNNEFMENDRNTPMWVGSMDTHFHGRHSIPSFREFRPEIKD